MNTIDCIEKCLNGLKAFERCTANCCVTTDNKMQPCDCLKTCLDGADIANVCTRLCTRDSKYALEVMKICEAICNDYATDCQPNASATSQACANVCQACH